MRLLSFLFVLLGARLARADAVRVELKSGLNVDGQLIDYVPADHLTLRKKNGRTVTIPASDIESVQMETAPPPDPRPPVQQPLVQQPRFAQPANIAPATHDAPAYKGRYPRRILQGYLGLSAGYAPEWPVGLLADLYDEEPPLAKYGGSLGLQLGGGFVWRYFGIGLEFRYTHFGDPRSDEDNDDYGDSELSMVTLEGLLKPRVGYKLHDLPIDIYFAVPHGIGGIRLDWVQDPTWVFGIAFGATWFFHENLGVNFEMGYTWRPVTSWYNEALREFTLLRLSFVVGSH